ncbi:MAG: hypothetical protein KBS65_03155 [Prevotella sp.]|nr:hypothetical protein [Candidatus Equicola stercoris]
MTLLDTKGKINNIGNWAKYAQKRSEWRGGLSTKQYKNIIDVYYLVSESYINFFEENWFEDDVVETNSRILKDLQKNMSPTFSGNCFDSKEQAKDVAEYVLTLSFPADLDTMKAFFKEVISGKLEFRCRYPIADSTALDLIKGLGELIK